MGTIGQIYIPLQRGDTFISDMDEILQTRYGKVHIVVKDCILVKEEFIPDGPELGSSDGKRDEDDTRSKLG